MARRFRWYRSGSLALLAAIPWLPFARGEEAVRIGQGGIRRLVPERRGPRLARLRVRTEGQGRSQVEDG